ncbi:unnamed protein product [Urochloa humidicola]
MDSSLPLVDESTSTGARRLQKTCFKRAFDGICSVWTSAIEFIQFGNRLAPEPMRPHLKIGNTVEMIEDDGHTFVEATIVDISFGNGMILVKSNCNGSKDTTSFCCKRTRFGQCSHALSTQSIKARVLILSSSYMTVLMY